MKKTLLYVIPILLCCFLLNACKKTFHDQQYFPLPVDTTLVAEKIVQSVVGFVTDQNGSAVSNAKVYAGTKTTTTDASGRFQIDNVSLSKAAGFIKITNTGYFDGYRTFVGIPGQQTFVRVQLVPKKNVGDISAVSGGAVTTTDGAQITLPANAVVNAATNAAYSGTIHVAAHLYNQNNISQFTSMMPGDQRGIDSDAKMRMLKSYGMLAVELTGDAGELLQIATGKEATITTPIPSALLADAPASIPLWSFDVANGLWKQESITNKSGNTYTGNVTHFSFWDGASGVPVVNLKAKIVNNTQQSIGNIYVCIRRADDPNIGASSFTNNEGYVSGAVLANTALVMEVYTVCGGINLVYSQNINATTSDIDLGTITANLGDIVKITARVVDCNGAAVTDGWVLLRIANVTWHMPVVNGDVDFSTTACTNMNSSYVAVNWGGSQQSVIQNITLVPGNNNLGTIQACGVSATGFLDYSIDNGPTIHLTQEREIQKMIATFDGVSTNIITIDRDGNPQPNMAFEFGGGSTIGSSHQASLFASRGFPSGRANTNNPPYSPLVVTITEFGDWGGFVAGSFSGHVQDETDHTDHLVQCNFRVRRQ
ncbi:carboxypeptidase-like regulatory domain-containing protein [Ferruginibacter sp. HRS2-29]|uniref:carboxypeptidase-like regulatory domain-containing protein n=1 Tax=Ferruginibacter sp. HRS2-29 TaxID=2487334 RepID=UPI0020CCFA0D|nr:carboxypeptidase-like regulatory domain-containing protein [Ferruginibacter sp. HRS2-29]MCP9750708.1 carboxypeptidase regulatory-like domain-containing protein [Ferruginibacter sp. HRS2-29]